MTNVTIKVDDAANDKAITDKKTLTTMLNSDDISLEEKLKAIEEAMQAAQTQMSKKTVNGAVVPEDPSLLTMCDSCQ